jgi:hypothetical protein
MKIFTGMPRSSNSFRVRFGYSVEIRLPAGICSTLVMSVLSETASTIFTIPRAPTLPLL